jgi:hypothetical protein
MVNLSGTITGVGTMAWMQNDYPESSRGIGDYQ